MSRIHLSVPHMGENEARYVADAFASNWLSTVGPNLDAFEAALSSRFEGLPCVALASGTAAIHLALRLLGVGPGDEVVCPTLTFVASVNPVGYLGARAVFVDSERQSWNMDAERLDDMLRRRKAQGRRVRAIVLVHLFGQSANIDAIMEVANRHEVPVLEDAAEALGTLYRGRQVGVFGPITAISFNGNKIITTTGGGALVAKDPEWVRTARFWSQQARDPGVAYEHTQVGYNYRMSNVLAGIGRGQLEVLDTRVEQRRTVRARYTAAFADVDLISPSSEASWGRPTHWLSCFLLRDEALRDRIIRDLGQHDIEARPVWKPMHMQPLFDGYETDSGEVAADLFARGICLPSSSSLTVADQARVIDVVRKSLGAGRARAAWDATETSA